MSERHRKPLKILAGALVIAIVPMQSQAHETLDGHFTVHAHADPYAETTGTPGASESTTTIDGNYIPNPQEPFDGKIKLNAVNSKPFCSSQGDQG